MKRLFFTICLMFVVTFCVAETFPSVAGVTFGNSYDTCKFILDRRFNRGKKSYQSSALRLTYYNISFAGEEFDYVDFIFQSEGTRTYLSQVQFSCGFSLTSNSLEDAKSMRDRLYKTFSEKYEFRWSGTNKDGFKYYVLGYSPNDDNDGFVVIGVYKIETKGGTMKYWAEVSYGPVNFIDSIGEI